MTEDSGRLIRSCRLFPGAAQGVLELVPLAFPTSILGLNPLVDVAPFRPQAFRPSVVFLLGGIQRCLRFCDRLLALSPLLLARRFVLAALSISTLLLALELRGGLTSRL